VVVNQQKEIGEGLHGEIVACEEWYRSVQGDNQVFLAWWTWMEQQQPKLEMPPWNSQY